MKTTQLSASLLALLIACAVGCGGSSKPASAPAPDVVAEPEPAGPTEPTEPAQPAEPPPPALPPIAAAPPPAAPGAPKAYVGKVLAFIPASARMVIGIDTPRLTATAFGQKVLTMLASSDAPATCKKLELAKLGNVVVGWGEDATVIVADGKMTEKMLLPCIQGAAKADGHKVVNKKIAGRTVHYSNEPDNGAWLAWTKSGMALAATTEPAVTAALDPKAAKISADLVAHTNKADHGRMVWVAGVVSNAEMSQLGMPPGTLKGGATVRAWLDLGTETDIDVVIGFESAEEAQAFDQHLRQMIAPMSQIPDVAKMLPGLQLGVHGTELHIVAKLDQATTEQFVNELK